MRLLPTIVRSVPRVLLAAAGAALPVVARAADAPPPTGPADVAADVDLADRFEALAELSFPRRVPTDAGREPVFAEQAALFRAAATLAPAEPRYARKLAEAVAYLPDVQPQFDALLAVLRLQPTDEFTWARLIDLHLSQMNAAGDKVKYLTAMERATSLPRTALAHAGAVHAQILVGQGRDSVARTLLTSVLTNNPLDADAVRLQYSLLPATAAPYARLQALLAVLRSNPLQPAYAAAVARLAADAGLAQESLPFYELSVGTASAQRQGDLATALDWGAEMYVGNRNADAYGWVRTVLGSSPRSSAAWYLDLLIVRSSGFPVARQDQDLQQATVALSNRVADAVNAVNAAVAGGPATRPAAGATGPRAATRPMDFAGPFPLPDASGAAAVIRRSDGADAATQPVADAVAVPPAARADFVEAVADLARLEIYFAKKPDAAAPLLDALAGVLPDNDPLLSQLRGLSDLVAGQSATPPDAAQLDRARGELLAVAATDPLAAIGLVQLLPRATPAEQQSADRAARKLLQDHAAGLVGAFVAEAVVNPRVQLVPNAQAVMPLQQALGSFPRDLLGAATQPQRLYTVHAEPVDVGRTVGEPLVARITLFNISPADLTVGDDGIIRPGLLVQLTTMPGLTQKPTSYPAFDTLSGPMVLRPGETLTQFVRVDQQALLAALGDTVGIQVTVDGKASTNPDVGLGGLTQRLAKPFVRAAVNAQAAAAARTTLNGAAAGLSTPHDRLAALGVAQAYVREVAQRNPPPQAVRDAADLANLVHRARSDASPAVATWATATECSLQTAANRAALIQQMANDGGNWRSRQMALLMLGSTPDRALAKQVAAQLQNDPQASVAQYARAAVALLDLGRPSDGAEPPPAPTPPPPVPRP